MRGFPLLSLLPLTVSSLAQRWDGWHPGPWRGHNNDSAKVIDLSGSGWTLTSQNGSIKIPATVPSQQYLDLYNANIIPDPLFGENNSMLSWVRDQNWTYSRTLESLNNNNRGNATSTFLVFEGLDTFTTITMCCKQVATTENMFRQYMFDVSDVVRSCRGTPELVLNFGPATTISHQIAARSMDGGVPCSDDPLGCKAWVRKEQNDFGWDWSPALVPAGPWKPISAVQISRNNLYVSNAAFDIYRRGQMNNLPPDQSQPWVFNASIDFTGDLPQGAGMQFTLTDAGGKQILQRSLGGWYSSKNTITCSTTIDPSLVQLWWPNEMGSQPLYNAKVDIVFGRNRTGGGFDQEFRGSPVLASAVRRVGFRTIVLNLGPITDGQLAEGIAPGSNWHLEINGREFYAKGSNLVPPDVFWPRVDETKMMQIFTLAKDAHMNLLRVWSSGAYLPDWIYDMADEMGLLLWSEFEFTDSPYPDNARFDAEYEAEAYYNVRRVNHHPSLALWAGGNELEAVELLYGIDIANYEHIQQEILIKCVYANTRSISYIPSSTYNGYLSLDFKSVRPQIPRYKNTSGPGYYYSDTDTYLYDAPSLIDLASFTKGRFADEFGFISLPSVQSWEEEAPPEDLYYASPTLMNHNTHQGAFDQMSAAVELYLPKPNLADMRANFSAWCYSTQVVHANAMQHQIAFYRRGSGMPERQLGALYWQLNDLWDTPSWSSIEYNNRQKVLHYTAKDIYSPIIVYAYANQNTSDLQIWVTSDQFEPVSGKLNYQWFDCAGNVLPVGGTVAINKLHNGTNSTGNAPPSTIDFNVGAINSTQVLHYHNLARTLANSRANMTNSLLWLSITSSDNKFTHSSVFHPTNLRDVLLQDPGLKISNDGSNLFTVTATKAVAAWVWLDYGFDGEDVLGYWSDNGFWLKKGESRTVTFTVWRDGTGGKWREGVRVRSVWDNLGV